MEITAKNEIQKKNIESYIKYYKGAYTSLADGEVQVVYYTSPRNNKPGAFIFKGRKQTPISSYYYENEERRALNIAKVIKNVEDDKIWKAERRTKIKANINVGDILYTSWGYEQTNIDFYKVVGLVGKVTAEYVKIGSEIVKYNSADSADVKPVPSQEIGSVQRGRIGVHGLKIVREYASKTTVDSTHHSSWGY